MMRSTQKVLDELRAIIRERSPEWPTTVTIDWRDFGK